MKYSLFLIPSLLTTTLSATDDLTPIREELSRLNNEVAHLQAQNSKLSRQLQQTPSKLTLGADFRISMDKLRYEMADGSHHANDALWSNRLWLNMHYRYDTHTEFGGQLAYNKIFGQRSMGNPAMMDGFDWVASETLQDDTLRVRSVYLNFRYDTIFGSKLPWSFGIGRRPSNNGKLISLREDDPATSPLGHISNAEFDGGNLKFYLEGVTGLKGASVKFAAGRGLSNAEAHFSNAPYSNSGMNPTEDITLFAINFVPYSDAVYSSEIQYTQADNLIDITNAGFDMQGMFNPSRFDPTFQVVGDLRLLSAYVSYDSKAVSDDFFGEALLFASVGFSQTDPDASKAMLGSTDSKTGYSIWLGTQFPSLLSSKGKIGIEYNHGSKYWRSFTYGEDTLIGSKIAARGNAYEAYWTEPVMEGLSIQLRYTYIDYDYSGSNGFFGAQSGTPVKISDIPNTTDLAGNIVDNAQDLRLYLRYRF